MTVAIKIYTANFCPYCAEVKSILTTKGFKFEETVVDTPDLRQYLVKITNGRKTLPQIFVNNNHLGGFDDFKQFDNDGELDKLKETQL